MKIFYSAPLHALWLLACLASGSHAQNLSVEKQDPEQTVAVTAMRDPAFMSNKDVVMLRSVFSHIPSSSRIRAGLRVSGKKDGRPVDHLQIQFYADGNRTILPLIAGYIPLDDLPASDDPQAEFLSNQKKGTLKLDILLTIALNDTQHFTAQELADALEQGNRIRSAVMPWYLRLAVPKFEQVSACFQSPGGVATVELGGARQTINASASDNCLPLKPAQLPSNSAIELNERPVFVRLL